MARSAIEWTESTWNPVPLPFVQRVFEVMRQAPAGKAGSGFAGFSMATCGGSSGTLVAASLASIRLPEASGLPERSLVNFGASQLIAAVGPTWGEIVKRLAAVAALVVVMACASHRWPNIPNPARGGVPGQLQKEWQAVHPEMREPGLCASPEVPTGITEIALERTPCYGFCPTYTLRMAADGSVEYYGQANVPRVGHHRGKLDPQSFRELALLALDLGFFEMADDYDCLVTDNPTVYVSVTRDGAKKTIRHYAVFHTGPPRLRLFEEAVDQYAAHIEWAN
jgi:hypothetical protein